MDGCTNCVERDQARSVEAAILGLLLNFDAGSIWAVEELVRQLSASRLEVLDAIVELAACGLIHRIEDFVFAARAASSFDRLDL